MTLDEILQSPALAELGAVMLEQSKERTQRKYESLNKIAERQGIVMVGDSIVEGYPLSEFFDKKIYNRGISGDTSGGMLRRLEMTALPLRPQLSLLWIGTNDVQDEIPIDEISSNLEKASKMLAETGSRVIVLSVLPVNESSSDPNVRSTVGKRTNKVINAINEKYRTLCEKNGWTYLDVRSCITENGELPLKYSEDGLHPNIEGYISISKVIAAVI